jgi:endonuclease YncB( thermonuclease family)
VLAVAGAEETSMWKPLAVALVLLSCGTGSAVADFRSYAVVQEDASLLIQNKVVRLYGIYIPQNGQFCTVNPRPPFCGTRAAAALEFKIQGFVTCQEMGVYDDGSISAVCWTKRSSFNEGTDLGAYLISNGLALAGPDAPFEYRALERIAQTTNQGVWGFQADSFGFR